MPLVCAGASVCVRVSRVYAFRIAYVNKILSFTNTLIINIAGQIRYCKNYLKLK